MSTTRKYTEEQRVRDNERNKKRRKQLCFPNTNQVPEGTAYFKTKGYTHYYTVHYKGKYNPEDPDNPIIIPIKGEQIFIRNTLNARIKRSGEVKLNPNVHEELSADTEILYVKNNDKPAKQTSNGESESANKKRTREEFEDEDQQKIGVAVEVRSINKKPKIEPYIIMDALCQSRFFQPVNNDGSTAELEQKVLNLLHR